MIYEDKNFIAFLDARPLNEGHTLVIPKRHVRWVWDLSPEEISEYYKVCHKIANAQRILFNTDWVINLIIGEAVRHAHTWLIPRFDNDRHGSLINFNKVKRPYEIIRDNFNAGDFNLRNDVGGLAYYFSDIISNTAEDIGGAT